MTTGYNCTNLYNHSKVLKLKWGESPGAALTVGHELLGGVNSVSHTFVSVTSEGARF